MVFSSITFLFAFLAATLLIYYCCPLKGKNWVLALSGLVFYAWGEPVYIVLMIFSTLVDYTAGRIIHRYADRPGIRKAALIASIVIELGLLGVFKYSSFLVGTVNGLLGLSLPDPALPLPIGISFYTFQSMSYTIDLYRGDTRVQKNYIYYLAYVSMFPQLVAGPIVRYEDIARELESRTVTLEKIGQGAFLFAVGLGKKALLYDKRAEEHYNIISAIHKSLRNSDPDAALYWTARMLEAGEDPLYIARRLIRFASEDIGMADSRALEITVAAYQACHFLGMPECNVHLAHAVTYLALAPKSRAVDSAYAAAARDARESLAEPVPMQIRNAPTGLMKELGYGQGYQFDPTAAYNVTAMQCLPDSLAGRRYYHPGPFGEEAGFGERLEGIRRAREEKGRE